MKPGFDPCVVPEFSLELTTSKDRSYAITEEIIETLDHQTHEKMLTTYK